MSRLKGKAAIVTGAGRGLGRAIAQAFARQGAKVATVSLTPANVAETVSMIEAEGGVALGVPCDVRDQEQIAAAVARTSEAFGPVDILVNNAFDHSFELKPLARVEAADIEPLMAAGPLASLRFMQAVLPGMAEKGAGRIINMATGLGVAGAAGVAPLAMAKESIRALSRVAAREWGAQGITVNVICPLAMTDGFAEMGRKFEKLASEAPRTPRPPPAVGRMGTPDDVAPVAVFLASDEAAYLTGYTWFADGGLAIDAAR